MNITITYFFLQVAPLVGCIIGIIAKQYKISLILSIISLITYFITNWNDVFYVVLFIKALL